jgi:long-chain fatty acid transport protein
MRRTAAAVAFASLLFSTSALASGFGLRDASASTLGVSYAGNAANGSVPTTLVFNPATVNDVGTFDFAVSSTALVPQTSGTFSAVNAAGGTVSGTTHPVDIVNTALVPSIALRYRLTDKIALGMQVSFPWGMITNYKPDPVTRYYATMSDVKSANTMFIAGYQITPELSLAAGVQVQYIKGRLAKAIDAGSISYGLYLAGTLPVLIPGTNPGHNDGAVELRAQDWSTGWVIGAEWKPLPGLSVGVSYRSAIYNTLKGNEYFTLDSVGTTLRSYTGMFQDSQASAKFDNPAVVTLGVKWDINQQWTVMAGADWTGWSIMKSLTAHSSNAHQPDDVTMFNYHDSWFGSLGAQYKTGDWKFSLGGAYDDTPTVSRYRTPGIPDGGRWWISGGVGYRVGEHMDLDLSIARLIAQKGNIALSASDTGNSARGSLTGSVNMRVTLIGLEMNYHL